MDSDTKLAEDDGVSLDMPKSQEGPCGSTLRFLLASSGVVHFAATHHGTRRVCLICAQPACPSRLYPACGAISEVSACSSLSGMQLCKRKACALAFDKFV